MNAHLSVHIHPQVQIVNSGTVAVFNCSVNGAAGERDDNEQHPTQHHVEWFHNGVPLLAATGDGNGGAAAAGQMVSAKAAQK